MPSIRRESAKRVGKKTGRVKKMKRRIIKCLRTQETAGVVSELLKGPAVPPPDTIEADLTPSTSDKAARLKAMKAKRLAAQKRE